MTLKKPEERKQISNNLPKKPMTFLEEILKGINLKKQNFYQSSIKPEEKIETKFNKPAEVINQNVNNCLLSAIKIRGNQLNKNNVSEDDSDGSDSWSD